MGSLTASILSRFKTKENTQNTEEFDAENIESNWSNWKLPKIPVQMIYRRRLLSISSNCSIKTLKGSVTLSNEEDTLQLLNQQLLLKSRLRYRFLHLGLVQIAIKPLAKEGLDSPVLLCLRDCRLLKFQDSLLSIVEANLSNGPFYFNCCPNFPISVEDGHILSVLTLSIRKPRDCPVAVTYRVVYKGVSNLFKPIECMARFRNGETVYYQSDLRTADKMVRKITKWDEVQVPESVKESGRTPPRASRGNWFLKTTEHPDGRVNLRFSSSPP